MPIAASPEQGSAQPQAKVAWELAGSIAAGIIGALIPALFGASASGRLVGMLVGTAVPPLITRVGRWQPLRASIGVAVAVTAIAVTYLGGTAVNRDAFPGSEAIAEAAQPEEGGGGGTPTPPPDSNVQTTQEDEVGIQVDHKRLRCNSDGTCDDVTITSLGPNPLQLGDIGFEKGPDTDDFTDDDKCDRLPSLAPKDTCVFAVHFDPQVADGQPREATLVIHQNLKGPATEIAVSAVAPPAADGDVGIDRVGCVYTPEGRLVIDFELSSSGDHPETILASAAVDDVSDAADVAVIADEARILTLSPPLQPGEKQLSLSIDAGDDGDPSNNETTRDIVIPAEPPDESLSLCPADAG